MKRFALLAALLLALASHAAATDLPLDWTSPETVKASGKFLTPEQKDVLDRAGLVVVIRKTTSATTINDGLAAIPADADLYAITKAELEGKSFEEIQVIANSMQ